MEQVCSQEVNDETSMIITYMCIILQLACDSEHSPGVASYSKNVKIHVSYTIQSLPG